MTDLKEEIKKATEAFNADMAKIKASETGTWVKVHLVWIAGLLGILFGFILGKVT